MIQNRSKPHIRYCSVGLLAGALAVCGCLSRTPAHAAEPDSGAVQRDGSIRIAGRSLRCLSVRNIVDTRLPNLGAAAPGVLVINPRLMQREPETVRLFVFHHECGHHHRGASELAADCYAVDQGVREKWLDERALKQVCSSFGNAPETQTHPSGERRCRNLDRCYKVATSAGQQTARVVAPSSAVKTETSFEPVPKLVRGPDLRHVGRQQSEAEPVARNAQPR